MKDRTEDLNQTLSRAAPTSPSSGGTRAIPVDSIPPEGASVEEAKAAADAYDEKVAREEAQVAAWSAMADALIDTVKFNRESQRQNRVLAFVNIVAVLLIVGIELWDYRTTKTWRDEANKSIEALHEVVLTSIKANSATSRAITVQIQANEGPVTDEERAQVGAVAAEAHAEVLETEAKVLEVQAETAPLEEKPAVQKKAAAAKKRATAARAKVKSMEDF